MKKLLFLGFFLISTISVFAQGATEAYIDAYSSIAISEMRRTGIPASIKLAQAVLESNSGRSEMALTAKNHFGIKCGSSWSGGEYYREDDDTDRRGRIIASCFRSYENATESFLAHSDFLLNNGRTSRYEFLFELSPHDYKKWAKGLSKAGYATDPNYPKKLIQIIEKYELYNYDDMGSSDIAYIDTKSSNQKEPKIVRASGGRILNDRNVDAKNRNTKMPNFKYYNEVKMILTTGSESLSDIAAHHQVDLAALINYNDVNFDSDDVIPAKMRIYLERKKISFKGKQKFHQIRSGEKMMDIAQHYAIDLDALYIRNRMPFGSEPRAGEKIQLKGLIRSGKRPTLSGKSRSSIAEKSRFVEETVEYIFNTKDGDKDQ